MRSEGILLETFSRGSLELPRLNLDNGPSSLLRYIEAEIAPLRLICKCEVYGLSSIRITLVHRPRPRGGSPILKSLSISSQNFFFSSFVLMPFIITSKGCVFVIFQNRLEVEGLTFKAFSIALKE